MQACKTCVLNGGEVGVTLPFHFSPRRQGLHSHFTSPKMKLEGCHVDMGNRAHILLPDTMHVLHNGTTRFFFCCVYVCKTGTLYPLLACF